MFNIPETNYRYVLNSEHRLLYGRTALTDFCMEEQLKQQLLYGRTALTDFCMEEQLKQQLLYG